MPITTILDEPPNAQEAKPLIESSIFRSYREFKKLGVKDIDIDRKIMAPHMREQTFLTAVDESKGPIIRKIRAMVRRKHEGKEYLTIIESWKAKDWKNAEIDPVNEIIEGLVRLPKVKIMVDEKGQRIGTKVEEGYYEQYEFLFSKAEVDKWIELTGTDKDSIKYCVRTDTRRDDKATYDQFINTTWVQANDILMQDGGFEMAYVESLRAKKKPA